MESTYQINNNPEWDDESYAGYFNESYGNDDEGILDDLGGAISSGVSAVGNILGGNPVGAVRSVGSAVGKILGVNTSPASTSGISHQSNLRGQVTTAGGKQVPIQLPSSTATKQDIQILQAAIQKINGEIKKVGDTTTNNGIALTKLTGEVKSIDEKHVAATKKQNELIDKLGKGLDKLSKDFKSSQSQSQMNMMLPMLMQPSLLSITEKDNESDTEGTTKIITKTEWESNPMMFLMMAMGSGSGDGNMFGDMGNNPMMMYFMMQAMTK